MDGVVLIELFVSAWIVLFNSSIGVFSAMLGYLVRRVLQNFALMDELFMFSVFCPGQMGPLPTQVGR